MDGKELFCGSSDANRSLLDYSVKSADSSCQNDDSPVWSRKQRRAYSRIRMGIRRHHGQSMRFLTLTGVVDMKRSVSDAHKLLKGRIKSATPLSLSKPVRCNKCRWSCAERGMPHELWYYCATCTKSNSGYIPVNRLHHFFPGKKIGEPLRYEYYNVHTSEGPVGVLHIPYFGDFLPHEWLADNWFSVSGAMFVWITATRKGVYNSRRLACYCVNQYCAGQSEYLHGYASWGWCYRGYIGVFKAFIKAFGFGDGCMLVDEMLQCGFLKSQSDLVFYISKGGLLVTDVCPFQTTLDGEFISNVYAKDVAKWYMRNPESLVRWFYGREPKVKEVAECQESLDIFT